MSMYIYFMNTQIFDSPFILITVTSTESYIFMDGTVFEMDFL